MYDSSCANTEPTSRSASAPEISEYGASGPGVTRPCWRYIAAPTASRGGIASAMPHHPGAVAARANSTMQNAMRVAPSVPSITPYGPKRPLPDSVPREMYAM
jgi:hypothetical protein